MNASHLDPGVELTARVDAAAIADALAISVGGASRSDLHLFAYLASMVSSQEGTAPSSWGYPFAGTSNGLPFAEALDYAIDRMVADGDLVDGIDGFGLSDWMRIRLDAAETGPSYGSRVQLIQDVANVAVFRALPSIGRAIREEPQLARSADIGAVRLIDESELASTLMRLMLAVRSQLPEDYPPSAPAMLWLDAWAAKSATD